MGKRWRIVALLCVVLAIAYYYALPTVLFNDPYSTVLEDRNSQLLSAAIANDGQWRFPSLDTIPEKFARALILYEDKRFNQHPGVDLLALGRAFQQNVRSRSVVSGGSTITMQLIRLSRKGRPRTYFEKAIEIVLATRAELRYSKEEILAMYASHAPFGGNVVGLEAACWRYFGRDVDELSWAEAATLAVLPNSPSLIHPGRKRHALKARRNALLDRLKDAGIIDGSTCELSKAELVPEQPAPLPRHARHLLQRSIREGNEQTRIRSTVDLTLQQRIEELLQEHHLRLSGSEIHNAAVLVLDTKSGNALAYVGNVNSQGIALHGEEVDVISSPRSTGSILKPFLFAAMVDEGKMLTGSLLPDVPILINGFAPKNFNREFDGAVPADKALIRSLNVPAVYMLGQYRYEKLHSLLKGLGMTTLTRLPDHYGLSLILGGAEGKLWDITGMYASMARVLNRFGDHQHIKYAREDIHPPRYREEIEPMIDTEGTSVLSAASIYQTFDVLKEVYRPGEESGWRNFYSARKIAWKTGTSFGHRDGWAVGVTPEYVVGVWVGNADGEGRPGLTGTETAAPIMFDVFSALPPTTWFSRPVMEMDQAAVCAVSGFRLSASCELADTVWVATRGLESGMCSFHKPVHVTNDGRYRVHAGCESLAKIQTVNWFILPPIQEYYYKGRNMAYRTLPPYKPGCTSSQLVMPMEIVYPGPNARLFIPRDLDGTAGRSVFELAHRDPGSVVHWHLDGEYIGQTIRAHRMPVNPGAGKHTLVLVDGRGDLLERQFEVVSD